MTLYNQVVIDFPVAEGDHNEHDIFATYGDEFEEQPVLLLTLRLQNADAQVPGVYNVREEDIDGFRFMICTSGTVNQTKRYVASWMAIGKRKG